MEDRSIGDLSSSLPDELIKEIYALVGNYRSLGALRLVSRHSKGVMDEVITNSSNVLTIINGLHNPAKAILFLDFYRKSKSFKEIQAEGSKENPRLKPVDVLCYLVASDINYPFTETQRRLIQTIAEKFKHMSEMLKPENMFALICHLPPRQALALIQYYRKTDAFKIIANMPSEERTPLQTLCFALATRDIYQVDANALAVAIDEAQNKVQERMEIDREPEVLNNPSNLRSCLRGLQLTLQIIIAQEPTMIRYSRTDPISYLNLASAELDGFNLTDCDLSDSNLENASFNKTRMPRRLERANCQGTILTGSVVSKIITKKNTFMAELEIETNANLQNMDFRGADLRNANLSNADVYGSRFLFDVSPVEFARLSGLILNPQGVIVLARDMVRIVDSEVNLTQALNKLNMAASLPLVASNTGAQQIFAETRAMLEEKILLNQSKPTQAL